MPTTDDRMTEAQDLLRRATRCIARATKLLAEPIYDELPPVAPAETKGEKAAAAREWYEQAYDADPNFRAFVLDRQAQERRRR